MTKEENKLYLWGKEPKEEKFSTVFPPPNVLAVHDISCIGRCSLTVALPILSAFGVECRILPTALLSTHTGGFTGFTYLDLTDEMQKILTAWRPLNLHFDAIYSGFMASAQQIDVLKNVIRTYSARTIIDPVMADNGELYSVFDEDFVRKMKELVPLADVLTPNVTEACFLTGTAYEPIHHQPYIAKLIGGLKKLGAKDIVLTGIINDQKQMGALSYRTDSDADMIFTARIPGQFHGTGDIFGSVLTAELMGGYDLHEATRQAVQFVVESIRATPKKADMRYGVNFEEVLRDYEK